MDHSSDSFEVDVFRNFVERLMSLQKQFDASYHDEEYLRDRLLRAVYIPSILESLTNPIPRITQQLVNRVANRFSEKL